MPAPRTVRDHRRRSVLALIGVTWAAALTIALPVGAAARTPTTPVARPAHTKSSAGHGRRRPRPAHRAPHTRRHRRATRMSRAGRHRLVRGGRSTPARRPNRVPGSTPASAGAPAAPLVFGIYPGGTAGTTGPQGPVAPEDPAKRLAALQQLRAPGAPFVLHIYAGYTGPGGWTAAQQVGDQITQYTTAGLEVELVLTYRPGDGGSPQDVRGFVGFIRQTIAAFGPNPRFVSLQVANETDVTGAPNASDGYYRGAEDALIGGVIAAKAAIRAQGFDQVMVGFNWASAANGDERAFWSYLRSRGGPAFVGALDWVGLDIYPGTWGPAIAGSLADGTTTAMNAAMTELRSVYLPLAGIPFTVPLHISESGYPTGPGRTPAMQVRAMRAEVGAVVAGRARFNITDFRWFDLRDADSASGDFQSQYGLMTDAYAPKPGFFSYQDLVARFGRE